MLTHAPALDPRRVAREPEPVAPEAARAPEGLTPDVVRFLQTTAGNQQVVARLQESAPGELSDAVAGRAVAYTRGLNYTIDVITAIQQLVGATPDGAFGPISARAVAAWQAANGLVPDGRPGPATLAAMGVAGGTPESAPTTPGPSAPASPGSAPSAPAPETAPSSPVSPGVTPSGPASPAATPTIPSYGAGGGELETLMAKERLSDEEMDTARALIAALPDEAERADMFLQLQAKVSYHSQRDNQSTDGGKMIGDVMCNLTSLAMCLEYLGVDNPYPEMQFEDALEKIRVEHVGEPRTTSAGWGGVATYLGVKWGFVTGAGANDQKWYEANVKPHLAAGEAMMLSIDGHICRLQGMTSEGLVADDPYGESTLGTGSARGWDDTNTKEAGSNAGEDLVWKWDDVARHKMLWIAWFQGTPQ